MGHVRKGREAKQARRRVALAQRQSELKRVAAHVEESPKDHWMLGTLARVKQEVHALEIHF